MDADWIRQQKLSKARGLLALENRINDMKEVLDFMKALNGKHLQNQQKLLKKDKNHEIELNKYLTDRIARYTKNIFDMEQVKVLIEMKPTADISLQLQIDEMLSKVKPEDLQQLIEDAKEKEQ